MIKAIVWDLGDTLVTPPATGMDLSPLDELPEIQLRPSAASTLRTLKGRGFIQAILSNTATSDSDAARRLLSRLGIVDVFAFIYATQSELTPGKLEKPDLAVFQLVLDAIDVSASDAVMVGNSWDKDILGANRSGIHAIWLQNPSVSSRQDCTTRLQAPPWVMPIWELSDVPVAVELLHGAVGNGASEAG